MTLHLWWEDDCRLIVSCAGEIGWDAADQLLKEAKTALGDRQTPQVAVDLEGVDCITSAGIGGLLQLRKLILERRGCMMLTCASPPISQLLRTVGIDRHVPMLDTLEQARSLLVASH